MGTERTHFRLYDAYERCSNEHVLTELTASPLAGETTTYHVPSCTKPQSTFKTDTASICLVDSHEEEAEVQWESAYSTGCGGDTGEVTQRRQCQPDLSQDRRTAPSSKPSGNDGYAPY